MKLVCMIPARLGSQRVKKKTIRYLGSKPLVTHVIETCKTSNIFDDIYLNSDAMIFKDIAENYGISFYKRDSKLATSNITNDLFMEDFLNNTECDYVIQVNPTSPFITVDDLVRFKGFFIEGNYGTVQSVKIEKIEAIFDNQHLNYDPKGIMLESQKLKPVTLYSSGIMGFKKNVYLENMKMLGAATYGGNGSIGYFELSGFSTVDIDYEQDFQFAEIIFDLLREKGKKEPKYYLDEEENKISEKYDTDRERILIMDGVDNNDMNSYNQELVSIPAIINKYGRGKSWSFTVVNSPSNCLTLIAQIPGEGNRMHYHYDWDEWWYIIEGEWEWVVEGVSKTVRKGDIVFIERNRRHKITAIGNKMAIRLAVSRQDVDHVYEVGDY